MSQTSELQRNKELSVLFDTLIDEEMADLVMKVNSGKK